MQLQQIGIIDGGVVDIFEIFGQKLPVLEGVMPPFISGNMRAEVVKSRINDAVKFPYSWGPILRGKYQLNNCYYILKKRFTEPRIL